MICINDLPKTVISKEYSSEWKLGDEHYYPVNDDKNNALYEKHHDALCSVGSARLTYPSCA